MPKAVERLCAVQSQSVPEAYLGLWSRLAGFRQAKLTRALERGSVVRATLFRMTLHYVSATNHAAFAALVHRRWHEELRRKGIPLDDLVARLERLAKAGPFTYAEAHEITPELEPRPFLLRCVTPLVHVPPAGTWGQTRVHLTTANLPKVEPEEAAALLVRRYLGAFGPATRQDLLAFSGLRVADVAPALDDLRQLEDEQGRTLYDVPRAPRPAAETPAPVRLLPRWDALLLSHSDRTRVLPEEYRSTVITGGWVHATFLVDGVVAGIWRLQRGKVQLEPFSPLPLRVRRELEDEARRLAAFAA